MKNTSVFLSENFQFLEVKFSMYLNRRVFIMMNSKGPDHPASMYGLIRTFTIHQ